MLDVIVYGATGYTGRLVAEHLFQTYGVGGALAWGIAGRDAGKLAEIRAAIGAPETLPTLVADARDRAALDGLVRQTRVVITTAGPYQLHGNDLVAACAEAGTDYCDLAGESNWIAVQTRALHDRARETGARLVFSCGFDSIPFDLGVQFLQEQAQARFGGPAPYVKGRVKAMRGGLSGGTLASGMATQRAAQADPEVARLLADPFALTPGFTGPAQPPLDAVAEDPDLGSWVGPFMMAAINTKAVHRTNFLLGHPWGTDFQYDELMAIPDPKLAGGLGFAMGGAGLPRPGEGPTAEERAAGFYDLRFIGVWPDGRRLQARVYGERDPGYGSTSRILGETGVALAKDIDRSVTAGGCWSPAAALGARIRPRLAERAGLTFDLVG